jgi:hypothetical protein
MRYTELAPGRFKHLWKIEDHSLTALDGGEGLPLLRAQIHRTASINPRLSAPGPAENVIPCPEIGDRPVTVTTFVERLDLPAALSRARSRRDTESDTVQFAQAALAAAKVEGLQLAVRARYVALLQSPACCRFSIRAGTRSTMC